VQEPVLLAQESGMTAPTMLRRFGSIAPSGRGIVLRSFDAAARSGRSIFPSRVFAPDELPRLLKSGHNSRKIGAFVTKGRRKGWPIYTLTLEERATCPRTCREWLHCYGNNMQAAERIEAGDDLEARLYGEVKALASAHPAGFMVRLHVLGDFYSERYVALWQAMLALYPNLHVFGFTAHQPGTPIGDALREIYANQWERFAVRVSGMSGPEMAAQVAPDDDPQSIDCPAQTGATDCCATCALCWHSTRSISFRRH
jgi:hypothetical protein